MKKIIVLTFLLITFAMKAEYISATLYFNDGSKKIGFAELVETEDKKVKFKTSIDGEKEKILSDDLKKIEFKDKKNNIYICERLKIWSIAIMKYKYFEDRRWLYMLGSKGNYELYTAVSSTTFINTKTSSYPIFGETFFYYRKKKEEVAYMGFMQSNAGIAIETMRAKQIKKMITEMFESKCNLDKEIEKIKFDRKSGEDPFKVLNILAKNSCK